MKRFFEEWSMEIRVISSFIFGLVAFVFLISFIQINFINNIPIKVLVDDKIVYQGISAGVDVESGGRTTKVTVKGGFLYMFPKKYFVSENVKIEGEK